MKTGFFSRLAWSGIRKNKRLYLPYIATCIGTITIFYIITFLSTNPLVAALQEGVYIQEVLRTGKWTITVFAVLFLFYSNSFLAHQRNKEFGLYNILGMDKRNLRRLITLDSVIISGISLALGLILGVALSKLAELALFNIMHQDIVYDFYISAEALSNSILVFFLIFFLLAVYNLWKVNRLNPLELMNSSTIGEKAPKANWFFAIAGVLILGCAYYLAVTIKNPVAALGVFFVAVGMVIVATYLLLIAGSVTLCKFLQKRKSYYYKPSHFISVSSMTYRMKRNGAGLASICILSTMILVMISSTSCLYIGSEDAMNRRYPRDINMDLTIADISYMTEENLDRYRDVADHVVADHQLKQENVIDYRIASIAGLLQDNHLNTDVRSLTTFSMDTFENVISVYMIPLADYNRMMGTSEILEANETLLYCVRREYENDTIQIEDSSILNIKKVLAPKDFIGHGESAMSMIPSIYLIVPDINIFLEPLLPLADFNGDRMVNLKWYYGFDLDAREETHIAIDEELTQQIRELSFDQENGISAYSFDCLARERNFFYFLYGGMFFIGIMLSVLFILAAILIIYYKQISEGYEDSSRFAIMQKVGMTKKEIRKSINSQILTVFFLPLVLAGIHLAFSFPLIWKILEIFNLTNFNLFVCTTLCAYLVFALFYAIVYRITSNSYYNIVSGGKETYSAVQDL